MSRFTYGSKLPIMVPNAVIMCQPGGKYGFYADRQTLKTNPMQNKISLSKEEIQEWVHGEWTQVVQALLDAGVIVQTYSQGDEDTPNAIFPNNWFSVNPESASFVQYPMLTESRQKERRSDIRDLAPPWLNNLDFTSHEKLSRALEGTGSLVLDRAHKVAYACLSPRTDPLLAQIWAQKMGYEIITFTATDSDGVPYYHTNVMMAVGCTWAVVCFAAIESESDKLALLKSLRETGKEVIIISREQVKKFCGNILELKATDDKHVLVMSKRASDNFSIEQFEALSSLVERVIAPDISTIEHVGGGGVRCLLAENFV